MNLKKLYISVLLIIFNQSICSASDFKGKWVGIEVMGCDTKTAQAIREMIPLQVGQPFHVQDLSLWCNKVKNNLTKETVHCSFIAYQNGKFYFDVDIISNKHSKFRQISPNNQAFKVPKDLAALLHEWDNSTMDMFKSGTYFNETFDKGYLDSNQPHLHGLALKLSKLSYRNNKLILKIIKESKDPIQRAKAATLLSWSRHPENIEYVMKEDLLNDPDSSVRNNLARSLSFNIGMIKDENLLKKAIQIFCNQAKLPTHSDRNKALISLNEILENHKNLSKDVNNECRMTLEYISNMSILPNVGGVAKNILLRLENTENV